LIVILCWGLTGLIEDRVRTCDDIDPVLDVGNLESEKADSALDAVDSASDEADSASREADSMHNDGKPLPGARRGTSSASDLACLQNEE
jgi:hypothetical protein